ncbi:MAG TPA: cytosine deaminase [Gammaproteobacteria bacterium]|nr:cytosine deaminase [Gammaproteobacteria bacterium]
MLDLLVKNARLPHCTQCCDIAIHDGHFSEIAPQIDALASRSIDAAGFLVSPPFVDSHFHMDSTLSYGQPRVNESGTLLEGIALWGELKPNLTVESIQERAETLCHWAIARGTLVIRSHVDISDDRLLAVQALLEVRRKYAAWLDLQLVAFPQDGYLRYANNRSNLARALAMGVDVIGGIPHFERTMAEGAASVKALCELAADHGLLVDMHCDESDDPWSRHIETLVFETRRLGLEGRVTGSHLTSMHSMDNYYVSKLLPLMREADIQVVANPLINITLQGRHDSYPKRRGMTRVKELLRSGINVSLGHDCVMDPWYSLGSHDMLEVAHMGLHVAQMTGTTEMAAMFDTITINGARTLGLKGYGVVAGNPADLVILQARTVQDALRLRAARLFVIRRGQVISQTDPVMPNLHLGVQEHSIDFML